METIKIKIISNLTTLLLIIILVFEFVIFFGIQFRSQFSGSWTLPLVNSELIRQYENKIIRQPPSNRGKDDGWYLVKNGKKRWIIDGSWLEKHGYRNEEIIELNWFEFNSIPEDPQPLT